MSILTAPRELFFTRTLTPDLAHKRYRALALVLHPDLDTGDTDLMSRLNAEFDAYERGELRPAEPDPLPRYGMPPQASAALRRDRIEQAGKRLIEQLPPDVRYEVLFTISVETARVIASGGRTYQNKDTLKLYGFKWDAAACVWAKAVHI